MLRKVAILANGGDVSGFNAVIRAIIKTAENKNILLKSVISKVTYLKTEKNIRKNSSPTNFELHIYPKICKC